MNGRGGCCVARYGDGGGGAYDMSQVDRIMLRFRPIAPKPAAAGSASGGSTPENSDNNQAKFTGRGKRKYVRVNKRRCNTATAAKKRKSSSPAKSSSGGSVVGGDSVVTLSLLPETPDRKDSPASGSPSCDSYPDLSVSSKESKLPIWLSFNNQQILYDDHVRRGFGQVTGGRDQNQSAWNSPQPGRLVGSCVTVESVTDAWVDGDGIGCKNEERIMKMERDTCPGFITDGRDRVLWTNKAYREMAGQVAGGEEAMVWFAVKELVSLPVTYPAFTCKVRVTCGKSGSSSLMLPCDVWRMEGGCFAWRLDINAALSLGR